MKTSHFQFRGCVGSLVRELRSHRLQSQGEKKQMIYLPAICNVLKSPNFSHFLLLLLQYELLRRNYHLDPMGISVWVEERSWKWGAEMFTEAAEVATPRCSCFLYHGYISFCHVHCDCGADVVGFWAAASKMLLGYLLTHIKIMALFRREQGKFYSLLWSTA